MWLDFVQWELWNWSFQSLTLTSGVSWWSLRALLLCHQQIQVLIHVLRGDLHAPIIDCHIAIARLRAFLTLLFATFLTFDIFLNRASSFIHPFQSITFPFTLAAISRSYRWTFGFWLPQGRCSLRLIELLLLLRRSPCRCWNLTFLLENDPVWLNWFKLLRVVYRFLCLANFIRL